MIFKRSKTGPYWFTFTFNGKRVQKSTKQFNKDAAKDIESAHRTSLAKGEVGISDRKAKRWKLDELLDRRLADLTARGKRNAQTANLNLHVRKDFGAWWADELTGDDLNAHFEKRKKEGYAVATVTNRIAEVISAYRLAGWEPPKRPALARRARERAYRVLLRDRVRRRERTDAGGPAGLRGFRASHRVALRLDHEAALE